MIVVFWAPQTCLVSMHSYPNGVITMPVGSGWCFVRFARVVALLDPHFSGVLVLRSKGHGIVFSIDLVG